MAEIIGFPGSDSKIPVAAEVVRRDDAVAQVRALEKKITAAEGDACLLRMAQGDVLIPIRDSVGHGRWLPFLADCRLSVRNAQIAMQLAERREEIEAANAKSDSYLSIAAALNLIRSEKPPKAPKPAGAPDPYSPETLIKLAAPDRARILAALNVTRADVPSSIVTEIEQHAVARERKSISDQHKQAQQFIKRVCFAVATSEGVKRQIENVKAAIDAFDMGGASALTWYERMDLAASGFKEAHPQSDPVKH